MSDFTPFCERWEYCTRPKGHEGGCSAPAPYAFRITHEGAEIKLTGNSPWQPVRITHQINLGVEDDGEVPT